MGNLPHNSPFLLDASSKATAFGAPDKIQLGCQCYAENCIVCHVSMVQSVGVTPDVPWSSVAADPVAWRQAAIEGLRKSNGMVAVEKQTMQAEGIGAHVLQQA